MKLTRMFATVFIDDSIFVIFTFFRRQIYVYKSRIMCAMCFKWSSDLRDAPLHVHRRRMIGNTTHTVAPRCLAPNYCCIYIFFAVYLPLCLPFFAAVKYNAKEVYCDRQGKSMEMWAFVPKHEHFQMVPTTQQRLRWSAWMFHILCVAITYTVLN